MAASVHALESHARMRLLERVFDDMTPEAKSELANAMASTLAKSDGWLASDFWKAALVALGPEAFAQEAALLEAIKKRIARQVEGLHLGPYDRDELSEAIVGALRETGKRVVELHREAIVEAAVELAKTKLAEMIVTDAVRVAAAAAIAKLRAGS